MTPIPCERCEPQFFALDMEWATEYARIVRERDRALAELADLRRSLRDAERTRDAEGWYGVASGG